MRRLLISLLALALILPPGMALAEDEEPTSPAPTAPTLAEREVFGFLPYWELGNAATIDLDTLTTLAWFGVEAGRDGHLIRETADGEPTPGWAGWTGEAFTQLLDRAAEADLRVVLVVERFAWDKPGRRDTKALLSDPVARAVLVEEVVDAVTARGAGGVNLDFEPLPQGMRSEFVRLVREMRAGLDAADPSLQLTFDLTPDVTSFPLARLTAPGAADAAVLMGYEYRTAGSRIAGSVAPLKEPGGLDLRESVKRTLKRAPSDRVILALPWYGRAWSTKSDQPGSATRRSDRFIRPSTALYRSAVVRAAIAGRRYDRKQASAWSVYPSSACETCPPSSRQLWYDDADSVRTKVSLALRRDLRGVGMWALGYQGARPELWDALRYTLGDGGDETPPSGTATIAPDSIVGEHDGLPLVDEIVRLDLSAADDPAGSGLALVRVSTQGFTTDRGSLASGTTFPAVDTVAVSLPRAQPVGEVFIPGASAAPSPTPEPSPSPELSVEPETLPAPEPPRLTLRVQWRDIAGSWSVPIELSVAWADQ